MAWEFWILNRLAITPLNHSAVSHSTKILNRSDLKASQSLEKILNRSDPKASLVPASGTRHPGVPGTPYLTAWANSGKSGRASRERALRRMAIRQARLE